MSEEMKLVQNDAGKWEAYDDTYDITIHCESEEEQKKALSMLKNIQWIPITEQTPEDESYILVSFENATMVDIARYEEDDEGGRFYPGDEEDPYSKYGIFVNAWMPLPELYKSEEEKQNEADRRRHAEKLYDR